MRLAFISLLTKKRHDTRSRQMWETRPFNPGQWSKFTQSQQKLVQLHVYFSQLRLYTKREQRLCYPMPEDSGLVTICPRTEVLSPSVRRRVLSRLEVGTDSSVTSIYQCLHIDMRRNQINFTAWNPSLSTWAIGQHLASTRKTGLGKCFSQKRRYLKIEP